MAAARRQFADNQRRPEGPERGGAGQAPPPAEPAAAEAAADAGCGAAVMVVLADGEDAGAAAGEDDAFLARPLSEQRAEGAGGPGPLQAERPVPGPCPGEFQGADPQSGGGPGDDALPRHPDLQKGEAERELRAGAAGAVHAGRGALHRAGHQGGGPGLHRLRAEPRDGEGRPQQDAVGPGREDLPWADRELRRRRDHRCRLHAEAGVALPPDEAVGVLRVGEPSGGAGGRPGRAPLRRRTSRSSRSCGRSSGRRNSTRTTWCGRRSRARSSSWCR